MTENQLLALQTINRQKTEGIALWGVNIMQWDYIDRLAAMPDGSYEKDPENVYLQMRRNIGGCVIDQYIPTNPLTMGKNGYDSDTQLTATTGIEEIYIDDMLIDSPEAVVENIEKIQIPKLKQEISEFSEQQFMDSVIEKESIIRKRIGPTFLKCKYNASFPRLMYSLYGYMNYFMAYALYPEVMEKIFAMQSDLSELRNRALARAMLQEDMPKIIRLDQDMADNQGTLVDIKSLDKIWFPHFERSIRPLVDAGINLIWHSDGNLMQMYPRLLDCGLQGFQGFQYEAGMDYLKICAMRTRDGNTPILVSGVSVTTTLPHGTADDVRKEMKFLVENGPKTGLFLGASSSVAPGVPWKNIEAMVEGFKYYRKHGHA